MPEDLTDDEVLSHYQTFDVPPADFDPRAATPEMLEKFGIPRRPDPAQEPELSAIWEEAFSRPSTFIKPELKVDRAISPRPRPPSKPSTPNGFIMSDWAGVIVRGASEGINPPDQIHSVTGEWIVPTLTPVAGDSPLPLLVGIFVGIDGFSSGNNQLVGQLLAAGMTATITGKSVAYVPFFGWRPDATTTILSNFTIKAGDVLMVVVNAPQTPDPQNVNQAIITFLNKTSGESMSLGLTHPVNVTSQGASAEWLVEKSSVDLPDFSQVAFTNISVGTESRAFNLSNKSDDIITNITDSNGKALTSTTVTSPTSAQVKWLGSA